MRRTVPLIVAIVAGFVVLADFFVAHPVFDALSARIVSWAAILGAFALLLGVTNLMGFHLARVRTGQPGRPYGLVLIASAAVVFFVRYNAPSAVLYHRPSFVGAVAVMSCSGALIRPHAGRV